MCVTSKLQQHIRNLTNDGEIVARFLVDTVQGKTPGVKACHQMEALKYLDRYGFSDEANAEPSQFWGIIPTPEELAASENTNQSPLSPGERVRVRGNENSPSPVSHLDILNYDIAHLIRTETADGHTIAKFLAHTMTGNDKPYTPRKLRIKPADRMAASREILRRGFGHFGRKRKLVVDDYDDTNDYDTLHTDLARRMREYTEHGTDAVRFLLDVMDAADPDAGFTWNHRVSAAQELLRRGWDTNYDNITPEMLQDYWQNQQSPGNRPPLPRGEGWGEGEISLQRPAPNNETIPTRHSHETNDLEATSAPSNSPLPLRGRVREGAPTPFSLMEEPAPAESSVWDAAEGKTDNSKLTTQNSPDTPDYYYEPLTPEQEAIFNYNSLIESGDYKEGEINLVPPTEEARRNHAIALRQIKEAAAAEGVPLLPNPLARTLKTPATIRSP